MFTLLLSIHYCVFLCLHISHMVSNVLLCMYIGIRICNAIRKLFSDIIKSIVNIQVSQLCWSNKLCCFLGCNDFPVAREIQAVPEHLLDGTMVGGIQAGKAWGVGKNWIKWPLRRIFNFVGFECASVWNPPLLSYIDLTVSLLSTRYTCSIYLLYYIIILYYITLYVIKHFVHFISCFAFFISELISKN